MLNIINDAQPAIKESLNSYIDSEGLRFINSQMYQMRENNDELNDIKERKRDILEQTRKYSEMIDSKKVELQQALEIDGIESSEAESLISNLGLTYMERLMQDIDLNTGLPVNEAGETVQPPAEGLEYSPVLHAWVNPAILRHIFSLKYEDGSPQVSEDRDWYIANYKELRNITEGVDQSSPEAQAFTPVTGTKRVSPLENNRDLIYHSKFGWLPATDINEVKGVGEVFNSSDLVSAILSLNIANDKVNSADKYGKDQIPFTFANINIDDNLNVSSDSVEKLPEQVVDKIAPSKPKMFERGGAAAQILAQMRGLSPEVGKKSSVVSAIPLPAIPAALPTVRMIGSTIGILVI